MKPNGCPSRRRFVFASFIKRELRQRSDRGYGLRHARVVTNRCGIAPLVDQQAGLMVQQSRDAIQAGSVLLLNDDDDLYKRLRAGCGEVIPVLRW